MNDHELTTTRASAPPSKTSANITLDVINEIDKEISDAPAPARPLCKADALDLLAPKLSRARDKGHSLAWIVQVFERKGIRVSERAVSRAIATARANKPTKKKPATSNV